MAWRRCGSLSRSLISTARTSTSRSSSSSLSSLPRLRPPFLPGHDPQSRRLLSTSNFGTIGGVIGCTQSLLPLHSVLAAACLTSHISVEARACFELSQGTFLPKQLGICTQ